MQEDILNNSKEFSNNKLTKELILNISKSKNEPEWMLNKRLRALELYTQTKFPKDIDLKDINFDEVVYFEALKEQKLNKENMSDFAKEKNNKLTGVGIQHNNEMVYQNLKEEWIKKGVIFENIHDAIIKYPELIKKYFMTTCAKVSESKFSMLHTCVWSGGAFIYIPKNVKIDLPFHFIFEIINDQQGQFPHSIIIADDNSQVDFIASCLSGRDKINLLHIGCTEIFVKKYAKVKFSAIENFGRRAFNFSQKKAIVQEGGNMVWLNGSVSVKRSYLHPETILLGNNSKTEILDISIAAEHQIQNLGNNVIHIGKNTSSVIRSKSICKGGGINIYDGSVKIDKNATNSSSLVECDSLILDDKSISNAYPKIEVKNDESLVSHEAKVGKISDDEIFYLMSRGLSEDKAKKIILNGFINPVSKKFPFKYAIELNKLINMQIGGSK